MYKKLGLRTVPVFGEWAITFTCEGAAGQRLLHHVGVLALNTGAAKPSISVHMVELEESFAI